MTENHNLPAILIRQPWNKGKLIGAKPPLRSKHVWSIRTKLQLEGRRRDLALFNLAIDSKLRGCDVVSIRVEDIAPRGYTVDRATVRQKKTGHPVRFEITEQTRQALDDYIRTEGKKEGEFLFIGRKGQSRPDYSTTGEGASSRHSRPRIKFGRRPEILYDWTRPVIYGLREGRSIQNQQLKAARRLTDPGYAARQA